MVRKLLLGLLVCGSMACWKQKPNLERFLLPEPTPPIGSIQARIHVIQGVLASQQGDNTSALEFFKQAHALDPHPTIQHLAQHCLNSPDSSEIELKNTFMDDL